MTRIRSIAAGELPAFTALTGPEHATDQAAYVSNMIERGAMRPDWCFVAEDTGRLAGRYALDEIAPKWFAGVSSCPDPGRSRGLIGSLQVA